MTQQVSVLYLSIILVLSTRLTMNTNPMPAVRLMGQKQKANEPVSKVGQFHTLLLDIEQVAVGVEVVQPVRVDECGGKWKKVG